MKQTIYLIIIIAIQTMVGCTSNQNRVASNREVDSARAYRGLGVKYDSLWQMRLAEYYYKKAFETYTAPSLDWLYYADSGYRYAYFMGQRGEMDGAVKVVTKILTEASGEENFPKTMKAHLLSLLAGLQLELGLVEDAKHNYNLAYQTHLKAVGNDEDDVFNLMVLCTNIFESYFRIREYDEANNWLNCTEKVFRQYEQIGSSDLIAEYKGHLALYKAQLLQATNHPDEAAKVYANAPLGHVRGPWRLTEITDYLMAAGRYAEAADVYARIDTTYSIKEEAKITFDFINSYHVPRYIANRKAGREAEALRISDDICAAIDSSLVWYKQNEAAELAVIYQTYEKELVIHEAKAETRIHRICILAVLFVCMLIGFLLWRSRKFNRILMSKNKKLYAEIEKQRQEQQQALQQLQAKPEVELSTEQLLYRRLCILMDDQKPYTNEDLNRESLAMMLSTNAKYVEQAIRHCSKGDTVSDFINRYRLEHVARLLKDTDTPISIIGEMSGIPSRSTLARLFRNAYGMTPTEYRRI